MSLTIIMQKKTIDEINEIYDLELEKIIKNIKREKAKNVLLQFPDGLKQYSQVICDYVEEKTGVNCSIFLGTCFGACDIPIDSERAGIDLIIQFGHSKWKFKDKKIKVAK